MYTVTVVLDLKIIELVLLTYIIIGNEVLPFNNFWKDHILINRI